MLCVNMIQNESIYSLPNFPKILINSRKKYRTLNTTENAIVFYLLLNKESNKWELSNELNFAYSGIYKSIKYLIENDLIKENRTEESKRNWKIHTTYYTLSKKGLSVCMLYDVTWENFNLILNNYPNSLWFLKTMQKLKKYFEDKIELWLMFLDSMMLIVSALLRSISIS